MMLEIGGRVPAHPDQGPVHQNGRLDTLGPARQSAAVPIDFLDLLADGAWVPAEASATGVRTSNGLDPSFGLHGVRLDPGFEGPQRTHDQPLLVLAFAGEVIVRSDGSEEVRLLPGQFCVIEEGTPHTVGAGVEGATFTECWPQDVDRGGRW